MLGSKKQIFFYIILCLITPAIFAAETSLQEQFLHAVKQNNFDTVKQLLEQDSRLINTKDRFGNTALLYAIQMQNPNMVELLLEHDADPNIPTSKGETPLIMAAQIKDQNIALKIAQLLVQHHADLNVQIEKGFYQGTTALRRAVLKENPNLVQYLLEKGANPNIPTPHAGTPLMNAVQIKNRKIALEITQLLMQYNADPDAQIQEGLNEGMTPLMSAVHRYNRGNIAFQIAELLIPKVKNVNAEDAKGHTALHYAIEMQNLQIIELLIKYGATVTQKDVDATRNEEVKKLLKQNLGHTTKGAVHAKCKE